MCKNNKRALVLCIAIFTISLIFVILIDVYVLNLLRGMSKDLEIIYIAMTVNVTFIIGSFIFSIIFVIHLFDKEINCDHLTGLFSRKKLFVDLNKMIKKKSPFMVCYIDFNEFKQINDIYGHEAGDKLLKEFSKRICELKPKKINGYRIGGDEFVIVAKRCIRTNECIKKIMNVTEEKVKLAPNNFIEIKFAIGIAENDFVSSADELIKKADLNMYKNKKT